MLCRPRWLSAVSPVISLTALLEAPAAFGSDPNWHAFGSSQGSFNATVYAAVQAGGILYVGGDFSSPVPYLARVHDTEFSALGLGPNGPVHALLHSNGELFAGGVFSSVGALPAPGVARWDGSAWSPLGSGVVGIAYALERIGSRLFVAGSLSGAGGQPVSAIAAWDGSAWTPLDAGLDGVVRAMCNAGTQLYVGGGFASGSGQALNRIAMWDGTDWYPLGSGVDGTVRAIAVVGADVYVGGDFSTAGGAPASRIARWDGASWHPIGGGVDGAVHALVEDHGELLAGGGFLVAGGLPASFIARWSDDEWHALGAGFNGLVRALAVVPKGPVAGGAFSASGQITAPRLARFDGERWTSPINQAPNEIVNEIVVVGDDVYVGGGFTRVAGIPANYVARWNAAEESWLPVGHGLENAPDSPVRTMAFDSDRGELYVADTAQFGGVINIVRWNGSEWQAVNGAFPAHKVHELAYANGILYAGGDEPALGSIAQLVDPGVVGGQWQSLGAGLVPSPPYTSVEVRDMLEADGYLYVAGRFICSVTNGTTYSLARWNGSTWSAVGDCCDSDVVGIWDLAHDGSSLFAIRSTSLGQLWNSTWSYIPDSGGFQATIEVVNGDLYRGNSEDGLTRWLGGWTWEPLGTCGVDPPVVAIAGRGQDIIVGGAFGEAGCKPSSRFAIWRETVVAVRDSRPAPERTEAHVYPNPFNPATTIRFSLSKPGITVVRIFDVGGRLVKTLANRSLPSGTHAVSWDGTRTNGDQAATGVYFCEVRTNDESAVVKLTLLK